VPKESELTRRITSAVKAGDKLVQDVRRDIGQIVVAANGVKAIIDDIKNKFKRPDDSQEV